MSLRNRRADQYPSKKEIKMNSDKFTPRLLGIMFLLVIIIGIFRGRRCRDEFEINILDIYYIQFNYYRQAH